MSPHLPLHFKQQARIVVDEVAERGYDCRASFGRTDGSFNAFLEDLLVNREVEESVEEVESSIDSSADGFVMSGGGGRPRSLTPAPASRGHPWD